MPALLSVYGASGRMRARVEVDRTFLKASNSPILRFACLSGRVCAPQVRRLGTAAGENASAVSAKQASATYGITARIALHTLKCLILRLDFHFQPQYCHWPSVGPASALVSEPQIRAICKGKLALASKASDQHKADCNRPRREDCGHGGVQRGPAWTALMRKRYWV